MVTGAEAADAAVKIARKWGIERKGISISELHVLRCSEKYHGSRTYVRAAVMAESRR